MKSPVPNHLYRVRLHYREPTYEMHTGRTPERPYRAAYEVEAHSEQSAIDEALFQFRSTAALSRVGWAREVVAVYVDALKAAG